VRGGTAAASAAPLVLTTERLTLRPLAPDDWPFYDALYADPGVLRWDAQGRGLRAVRRLYFLMDRAQALRAERAGNRPAAPGTELTFVLCLRDGKGAATICPVGTISTGVADVRSRSVEFGFAVPPAHQGRGYATEAARAVAAHLFDAAGVRELRAVCRVGNAASARVLTKLGMRRLPPSPPGLWGSLFPPPPEQAKVWHALTLEEWRSGGGTAPSWLP